MFPLWPAPEYAQLCKGAEWGAYEAREIPLEELLDDLLPKLEKGAVRPAVFPTPHAKGVVVTVSELAQSLRGELEAYE